MFISETWFELTNSRMQAKIQTRLTVRSTSNCAQTEHLIIVDSEGEKKGFVLKQVSQTV